MLDWSQLLLPALYSSIAVFIVSSLIHTVLKYHAADMHGLTNEDEVRAAIRKGSKGPGMYMVPFCSHGGKQDPAMVQKFVEGPNALMFVRPSGAIQMGAFLGKWFVYCFVISMLAGYVAMFSMPATRSSMDVFRLVGTVAWLAYAWAGPSDSIWMGKPWSSTFKHMFDGLVYACITGLIFGWQLHSV